MSQGVPWLARHSMHSRQLTPLLERTNADVCRDAGLALGFGAQQPQRPGVERLPRFLVQTGGTCGSAGPRPVQVWGLLLWQLEGVEGSGQQGQEPGESTSGSPASRLGAQQRESCLSRRNSACMGKVWRALEALGAWEQDAASWPQP